MRINKLAAAVAVTAVAVAGTGVAYAYWTAGGSGTGTAATENSTVALVVNQGSTISNMHPGDAAQTLSGTYTNKNDYPVFVGTVTAALTSVTKADGVSGSCGTSDYTLTSPVVVVNSQIAPSVVTPGTTPTYAPSGSWTGPQVQFNNKPDANQDGCKGATLNLSYTISSVPFVPAP